MLFFSFFKPAVVLGVSHRDSIIAFTLSQGASVGVDVDFIYIQVALVG